VSHKRTSNYAVLWSCEFATLYYGMQKQLSRVLYVCACGKIIVFVLRVITGYCRGVNEIFTILMFIKFILIN